jgi:hypothetical protein
MNWRMLLGKSFFLLCVMQGTLVCSLAINAPIMYLPFDEDVGPNVINAGSGAFTISENGADFTTDGYLCAAYEFDGIDDSLIVTSAPDLGLAAITMCAWVRSMDYTGDTQVIMDMASGNLNDGGFNMHILSSTLRAAFWAPGFFTIVSPVVFDGTDNGKWHFVAATYASVNGTTSVKLYLNANLIKQEIYAAPPLQYGNQTGLIGDNWDTPFHREFWGTIDELRLYAQELSQAEIEDLMAFTDLCDPPDLTRIGPAVYYPRSSSHNVLYQLMGRDSPLTNVWYEIGEPILGTADTIYGFEFGTGPTFLPARSWSLSEDTDGVSLDFDGVDDFAFYGHDSLLNLSAGMTLEAWVYPSAANAGGTVIAKAISPAIITYRLGLNASSRIVFDVFNATGTPFVNLNSLSVVPAGTWTHIAATYDGTTAAVYVNGAQDNFGFAFGIVRISSLSPLVIGGILGVDPYAGLIDEVRIWDHARSAVELFAAYQTKVNGTESGLVAYWQLRDSGSQTDEDSSANGFDLILGEDLTVTANDPTWFADSFPSPATTTFLFEFGVPWFSVFWDTELGTNYTLQVTTNLVDGSWSNLMESIPGTGDIIDYFDPPAGLGLGAESGEPAFYRVQ